MVMFLKAWVWLAGSPAIQLAGYCAIVTKSIPLHSPDLSTLTDGWLAGRYCASVPAYELASYLLSQGMLLAGPSAERGAWSSCC